MSFDDISNVVTVLIPFIIKESLVSSKNRRVGEKKKKTNTFETRHNEREREKKREREIEREREREREREHKRQTMSSTIAYRYKIYHQNTCLSIQVIS